MKNVWIVFISSAVILAGLYWFYVRDSGTSNIQNLSSTTTPANLDSNSKTDIPNILNQNQNTSSVPIGPSLPTNSNQTNNMKITTAVFHTSKGDITVVFNPETPNTVANFIKLAQSGFYDGTKFHRVIKGFMSQGGDPLSKDDSQMSKWGTGGPGYTFKDEIGADNKNNAGTLAMANAGPDTNGSQFFFNAANNNFLDTKHTVFGMITAGADVMMAINSVQTGTNDRPVEPVIIKSIILQ